MARSIVTSKGRVTIPIEVRKELGIRAGDKVGFRLDAQTGECVFLRKTVSIMDLYGMFKHAGRPVTIEEMDQAIADHLGEEDERSKREYRERS